MKLKSIKTALLCTALVVAYCNTPLHAAPAEVMQTGQTLTSPVLDPAVPGSDGAVQAGVAWPSPRFTEVTDGCDGDDFMIRDNLTGLVWLGNANDYNGGSAQIWGDALNINGTNPDPNLAGGTNQFSYCGHSDWRMPNLVELKSLLNLGQSNQASWLNNPNAVLNDGSDSFVDVEPGTYWSSSTYALNSGSAWNVSMYNGDVAHTGKIYYAGKQVLPVRGPVDD